MTREDTDELLDIVIKNAQRHLSKYGEFHPFGAAMGKDGKGQLRAAYTGEEHPSPHDLIALLIDVFRVDARANKLRATALCINATVIDPRTGERTDAVEVRLEDVDGESADCYLPYSRSSKEQIEYGEIFAVRGSPSVFKRGPP